MCLQFVSVDIGIEIPIQGAKKAFRTTVPTSKEQRAKKCRIKDTYYWRYIVVGRADADSLGE